MAFFGKKWKKTNFENLVEFMDAFKVGEKTKALFSQSESVSSFVKNADGTIHYISTLGDKEVYKSSIVLGEEKDFTTPDGLPAKLTFTLEGETLKARMVFPDGKGLYMNREFGADKMVLTVSADGIDTKAKITYASV